MTAPEQPVKQEEMAALDVDGQNEYLQHGNGSDDSDHGGGQPSPLALLAATCSKIGSPSVEEDGGGAGAGAASIISRGHMDGTMMDASLIK
ncbi:hypothetical protein FKM82_021571 [Ascaphus truei]